MESKYNSANTIYFRQQICCTRMHALVCIFYCTYLQRNNIKECILLSYKCLSVFLMYVCDAFKCTYNTTITLFKWLWSLCSCSCWGRGGRWRAGCCSAVWVRGPHGASWQNEGYPRSFQLLLYGCYTLQVRCSWIYGSVAWRLISMPRGPLKKSISIKSWN